MAPPLATDGLFINLRFRLPMPIAMELKRLARLEQRSFVAQIRRAIDEHLQHREEDAHGHARTH